MLRSVRRALSVWGGCQWGGEGTLNACSHCWQVLTTVGGFLEIICLVHSLSPSINTERSACAWTQLTYDSVGCLFDGQAKDEMKMSGEETALAKESKELAAFACNVCLPA
eukprot:5395284-Heterocapsa_arctica.AAC.1